MNTYEYLEHLFSNHNWKLGNVSGGKIDLVPVGRRENGTTAPAQLSPLFLLLEKEVF
jgi:hypothetical protein